MKVIELLNDAKDVRGGESPRIQGFPCLSNKAKVKLLKWAIGKRILVELVSLAKDAYDVLTFTTFFFSIGRQLEPHHFNLIFPLPSHYAGENNVILDTVENMFIAASERGSLGIALSALPLFSCHIISRRRVVQLIYHCLAKIKENVLMRFSETAHTSGEEEIFLHQLFWFGVKLEDAMKSLEENRRDEVDQSSLLPNDKGAAANSCQSSIAFSLATGNDDLSSDDSGFEFVSTSLSVESSSSDASSESYFSEECEENRRMSPCRTPKQTPGNGFVSKVVTSLFSLSRKRYSKHDSFEEDAINDAASSFILSGFDSTVKSRQYVHPPENETLELEFLSQEHAESNGNTAHASRHTSLDLSNATVAGAVSIFIGNAIGSGQNIDRDNASFESGWKIVSAIAHLIQGDRETSAITSAGSVNARKISQLVTNEDLLFVAGNYTIHERRKEDYEMIVSFLERRISECEKQLCLEATSIVFNLIVLLLLRHDVCQDVKLNRTSLVIGGIVSGHLSGRLEELVDLSRSNTCMIHDICSSLATRTAELLTMQF